MLKCWNRIFHEPIPKTPWKPHELITAGQHSPGGSDPPAFGLANEEHEIISEHLMGRWKKKKKKKKKKKPCWWDSHQENNNIVLGRNLNPATGLKELDISYADKFQSCLNEMNCFTACLRARISPLIRAINQQRSKIVLSRTQTLIPPLSPGRHHNTGAMTSAPFARNFTAPISTVTWHLFAGNWGPWTVRKVFHWCIWPLNQVDPVLLPPASPISTTSSDWNVSLPRLFQLRPGSPLPSSQPVSASQS